MRTDCLLPRVVSERFAVNPGAVAITWKLPPLARPSRFPLIFRLLSLQAPESAPPRALTLLARLTRKLCLAQGRLRLMPLPPALTPSLARQLISSLVPPS